jgi:hypothetical protein
MLAGTLKRFPTAKADVLTFHPVDIARDSG